MTLAEAGRMELDKAKAEAITKKKQKSFDAKASSSLAERFELKAADSSSSSSWVESQQQPLSAEAPTFEGSLTAAELKAASRKSARISRKPQKQRKKSSASIKHK